tara:strand:+ start:470 stop:622 length:153 start_codon:yes stop_codon:yes gene_type:complete
MIPCFSTLLIIVIMLVLMMKMIMMCCVQLLALRYAEEDRKARQINANEEK